MERLDKIGPLHEKFTLKILDLEKDLQVYPIP